MIISPTWSNGRVGVYGVSKRLDRFLVSQYFVVKTLQMRSWVQEYLISNHHSILLQVEKYVLHISYPFKFNSTWLEEEEFINLVKRNWPMMKIEFIDSPN